MLPVEFASSAVERKYLRRLALKAQRQDAIALLFLGGALVSCDQKNVDYVHKQNVVPPQQLRASWLSRNC